jgi:hypothetical protein
LTEEALREYRQRLGREALRDATAATETVVEELRQQEANLRAALAHLERQTERLRHRFTKLSRPDAGGVLATSDDPEAFVYQLVASDDPSRPRYVGSTHNPTKRLRQHLSDRAHPKVQVWVQSVRARGAAIEMRSLAVTTTRRRAYEIEQNVIAEYAAKGLADLNSAVPRWA